MKIYINDLEMDKSFLNVNTGLNYGRFNYTGLVVDQYKIILTFNEFADALETDYNSIRDEIRSDDELQNETSEFTAINYGSITALLKNEQALQDITSTYLDKILFSKLFAPSNPARYIINSTDRVEVKNGNVEISGRSYQKQ